MFMSWYALAVTNRLHQVTNFANCPTPFAFGLSSDSKICCSSFALFITAPADSEPARSQLLMVKVHDARDVLTW